jgi:uncharacterized membrane-anchored protein YjiN (DUF445 family)
VATRKITFAGNVEKRRRLRRLRILAIALLTLAIFGMLVSAHFGGRGFWEWSLAFCEAAAVGALADWFAVAALFRRPLGLPIPHTDVLARRKTEIGEGLADFVSGNFLQPVQLAAKLREQDFVRRFAQSMAQQDEAGRVAGLVRRYALDLIDALSGSQLETAIGMLLRTALERLDASRLTGNWLDLLTRDNRHHEALNEFLRWLADLLGEVDVQDRIFRSIADGIENQSDWWRTLNKVGLADLISGEITKSLPMMVENLQESLRDPTHSNRAAFDDWLNGAIKRLKNDPQTQDWLNERIRSFTDSPGFRAWLVEVGRDARGWLHDDLAREDSMLAYWLATGLRNFAQRLQSDSALREEMESRLEALAISLAPGVDDFIHKHIRQTVDKWRERDLIAALELEVGPDLQYIRFNGTLVGGLIGLMLHALVVFVLPLLA